MGCIYMYTNKINGMRYIGQTKCRIQKRDWEHWNKDNSYIDRALRKYGKDNFSLEILEDSVDNENLDEREIYWIAYYDSFNNGYNLTKGGKGAKTFCENKGHQIIKLLKNSEKTMKEIGEELDCSVYTVSGINQGEIFFQPLEDYPIRKSKIAQKYFQQDLDNVSALLSDTEYSFQKIADLTNTNFYYVCDVNRGKVKGDYHNIPIPIRKKKYDKTKMTEELAHKIIELLREDLSAEQVAKIVGVPTYTVGEINRGKMAICKKLNETFPIQKTPHRNKESAQKIFAKLSKEQVFEIVSLLLNSTLSLEEIARRYSVSRATIDRINQKKTWKNILADYEAPIRTNPKNKIPQ